MGNGASASAKVAVSSPELDAKSDLELDAPIKAVVQIKKSRVRQVEVKPVIEKPTSPEDSGHQERPTVPASVPSIEPAESAPTETSPNPKLDNIERVIAKEDEKDLQQALHPKLLVSPRHSIDTAAVSGSPTKQISADDNSPLHPLKAKEETSPLQLEREALEDSLTSLAENHPSPYSMIANNDDIITEAASEPEGEDMSPVQLLLQYIPYYGQGDPTNDSTVRAALSSMSVEDIDSKDEYGNTLLLLACQYRCDDLIRIMLNKGADPNAVNSLGACCLHFACYKESQSYSIAKVLLQNGANPEVAETTYGCTPLHYCAGTGDINFCKLLLSHGAQIHTRDYYEYTCVDYAKEANMPDCVRFLQERLDKFNMQNQFRGGMVGGGSFSPAGMRHHQGAFFDAPNNYYNPMMGMMGGAMGGMGFGAAFNEWQPCVDPSTGGKYFTNVRTAECLWEQDFRERMQQANMGMYPQFGMGMGMGMMNVGNFNAMGQFGQSQQSSPPRPAGAPPPVISLPSSSDLSASSQMLDQHMAQLAVRGRVVEIFKQFATDRLVQADELIEKHKGREDELLRSLCHEYKMQEDIEINAFQATLKTLREQSKPGGSSASTSTNILGGATPKNGGPPLQVRRPSIPDDLKHKILEHQESAMGTSLPSATASAAPPAPVIVQGISEAMVQAMMAEARTKHETQLEEERANFRSTVSEKDGTISILQSEVQQLQREKTSLQEEMAVMQEKLNRTQLQGGEALSKSEEEITRLLDSINALKVELNAARQDLSIEAGKTKSMETMIANLTSGHEEAIAREQAAAEERARLQKEREEQFAKQLQAEEMKHKFAAAKAKDEMSKARTEWNRLEEELRSQFDQMKKTKENEIDALSRELAELKARTTQELTAAQMKIDDLRKTGEEMAKRAEAAEAIQRSLQEEINEARAVQQFNAQLHKDLAREQLARKRLHNEIEDMKGKIRVYVRIRPFSNSERDRGCMEAVVKDGKISVLVRGAGAADSKKNYDFDQVFGGADGNTQVDIFRDTKHLIMSVVDGYNVCIFAYGQTGAGKSFTMIGAADIGNCLQENGDFDELAGITPRAVSELFRLLTERAAQVTYVVEVQMFQLYRDGLDDLLVDRGGGKKKKKGGVEVVEEGGGPLKITLAEHSSTGLVQVEGAVTMTAETPGDVMRIFAKGSTQRATASTMMNAESSRSHLICSLVVKLTNRRTGAESIGKLTLVDLAGSERVDKSGATGEQLKEAQSINKSLSALGDVIGALTSSQGHVPYRNHPLTMLMSDSLGGNAKTLMFVNCSPADYNSAESNSSLAFAARCRNVTNAVSSAPGVQAAQMMALKKELAKLKKAGAGGGGGALTRPI